MKEGLHWLGIILVGGFFLIFFASRPNETSSLMGTSVDTLNGVEKGLGNFAMTGVSGNANAPMSA